MAYIRFWGFAAARRIALTLAACVGISAAFDGCTNGVSCSDTRSCGGAENGGARQEAGTSPNGVGGAAAGASGGAGENGGASAGGASSGGAAQTGGAAGEAGSVEPPDASPQGSNDGGDAAVPNEAEAGPLVCATGLADCDGDRTNGCEANLALNPNHCGTCKTNCDPTGTVSQACNNGVCAATCDTAHLDCNDDGTDGCEIAKTDPNHCGTCDHVCKTDGTASLTCSQGVCKPVCDTAHKSCDDVADNGCEIDVQTDPDNCGACGHKCSLTGATARACVAGVCAPTCGGSTGDCTTPPATGTDDGCETNLVGDANNCGACGQGCQGGTCSLSQCQPLLLLNGLDTLAQQFTVDAAYIHLIDGGVVERSSSTQFGGTFPLLQGQGGAGILVNDGTYAYWLIPNSNASGTPNGAVRRITLGATPADDIDIIPKIAPVALAVDGKNIYWVDAAGDLNQATRTGKTSGTPLATFDTVVTLATDGKTIFVGLAGSTTVGFGAEPVGGGSRTLTASPHTTPEIFPYGLTLDATHLYAWGPNTTSGGYQLLQMAKTLQGNPKVLVPTTNVDYFGLATDSKFVYFAQPDGIYRVPNTGGQPKFLAASTLPVHALIVLGNAAYWIDPSAQSNPTGRVLKLALFPN